MHSCSWLIIPLQRGEDKNNEYENEKNHNSRQRVCSNLLNKSIHIKSVIINFSHNYLIILISQNWLKLVIFYY